MKADELFGVFIRVLGLSLLGAGAFEAVGFLMPAEGLKGADYLFSVLFLVGIGSVFLLGADAIVWISYWGNTTRRDMTKSQN